MSDIDPRRMLMSAANVSVWFEIPTRDLSRAKRFYDLVFGVSLKSESFGPHRLAERLQVAERTIYRDIRELSLSGVPVEGEAGVGYLLRKGFDVPPLMFTRDELEALIAGARMVRTWGGEALSASAQSALEK